MKNLPKVFVVVLNYNGKNVIQKCLMSVFKITYPNFEVVVVDNGSEDGSFELAKSYFSKAHFILNEANLGFSAGNNVGIRFSLERLAEYVLLLNNDVEVEEDFLTKLVYKMESSPSTGIISPVIFNGYNKRVWFAGGKIHWLRMKTAHDQRIHSEEYLSSEFISGCAMLVRDDVFKKVGLLDKDYFLYWEDVDFSVRARNAGFSMGVLTSSWVYHFERSERAMQNKVYWLVFSGLLFFEKNASVVLKLWTRPYTLFRRLKNYIDVIRGRNELANIVRKAYQDFKYAKK